MAGMVSLLPASTLHPPASFFLHDHPHSHPRLCLFSLGPWVQPDQSDGFKPHIWLQYIIALNDLMAPHSYWDKKPLAPRGPHILWLLSFSSVPTTRPIHSLPSSHTSFPSVLLIPPWTLDPQEFYSRSPFCQKRSPPSQPSPHHPFPR